MPGICGFCGLHQDYIKDMQNAYLVNDNVEVKDFFADKCINIAQTGLKKIPNVKTETKDVVLFVDGTVYNLDDLNKIFDSECQTIQDLIIKMHAKGNLKELLHHIDGYYSACLYDKHNKKVYLFSDRMGLRFLYYYCKNGIFAFASETKSLLVLKELDKTLDVEAINTFLDTPIGFFPQDRTYFENIKLIKPSSIITYDIENQKLTQEYYWKFSDIKQQKISYKKAIDKLHDILLNSMRKRLRGINQEDILLSLSGGLDSRLCLALCLECGVKPSYVWTMGKENSLDAYIAKIVCDKVGLEHHHFVMNKDNWFEPRTNAIWLTDGFFNFSDTHGIEFYDEIAKHGRISLDGYMGDVILGGGFKDNNKFLDKRITKNTAYHFYSNNITGSDVDDEYYNSPHLEPHLYMNRVRRFTGVGNTNSTAYYDLIMPFIDNDVLEFVFSIPDKYRQNHKLYADMVLKYYPELFEDIPWQSTGRPVAGRIYKNNKGLNRKIYIANLIPLRGIRRKIVNKISNDNPLFRKYSRAFADYESWFKQSSVKALLSEKLASKDSLHKKYLKRDLYSEFVVPFFESKLSQWAPSKALTVEIYLELLKSKQVF